MQSIQVKIESFGEIERILPAQLCFNFPLAIQVNTVLDHILMLYPHASEPLRLCACAIGEHMVTRQMSLQRSCTLVLLSPVAGG